ncbi:hypothetical protein HDU93_010077 [Gonapodya sp. JEL0774]|nr:hypothetical protein HDU93_010077 [Gonapodya sp. JEL0774]
MELSRLPLLFPPTPIAVNGISASKQDRLISDIYPASKTAPGTPGAGSFVVGQTLCTSRPCSPLTVTNFYHLFTGRRERHQPRGARGCFGSFAPPYDDLEDPDWVDEDDVEDFATPSECSDGVPDPGSETASHAEGHDEHGPGNDEDRLAEIGGAVGQLDRNDADTTGASPDDELNIHVDCFNGKDLNAQLSKERRRTRRDRERETRKNLQRPELFSGIMESNQEFGISQK